MACLRGPGDGENHGRRRSTDHAMGCGSALRGGSSWNACVSQVSRRSSAMWGVRKCAARLTGYYRNRRRVGDARLFARLCVAMPADEVAEQAKFRAAMGEGCCACASPTATRRPASRPGRGGWRELDAPGGGRAAAGGEGRRSPPVSGAARFLASMTPAALPARRSGLIAAWRLRSGDVPAKRRKAPHVPRAAGRPKAAHPWA